MLLQQTIETSCDLQVIRSFGHQGLQVARPFPESITHIQGFQSIHLVSLKQMRYIGI